MKPGKKILFTFFLVLLPAVLLIFLELAFRLLGIFTPEPLFFEIEEKGQKFYQTNQWVARRYFDPQKVSLPGAAPEKFAREKSPAAFRIFCLGGSSTAGFPFDCQVPFPQQLKFLLSRAYPGYRFEVLNLGISAVNSFTVLDLLPEILDKEPDLLLIYMGHNEFYGAYGSASSIGVGQNERLVRFYLKVQKLRLAQMMKRIIARFSPPVKGAQAQRTLMAGVIKDREIGYQSEKYLRTLNAFRTNLGMILQMCREKETPVMLGNLVSNVRDMPPFASAISSSLSEAQQAALKEALETGDGYFRAGNFTAGLASYRAAYALDSLDARLCYQLGATYAALHDSVPAARYLYRAKDLDVIRFRASEDVNRIIRDLAAQHYVPLVDLLETFKAHSPLGLIGKELLCDHLHPNPQGYYLMAETFYRAIAGSGKLQNPDPEFTPGGSPYFVTDLDWDIGLLKIFEMVHRWPFEEKPLAFRDYRPYREPAAAKIAYHYLFEDNVWSKAHYKLAEEYLSRKDFERARQEYLAVSMYVPDEPYPLLQIAKTFEIEENWGQREVYLEKALPLTGNKGMIRYQLALAQWKQGKLEAARRNMENAAYARDLTAEQQLNARFYLAGFLADAKRKEDARKVLREILQINPRFQPAITFLERLEKPD